MATNDFRLKCFVSLTKARTAQKRFQCPIVTNMGHQIFQSPPHKWLVLKNTSLIKHGACAVRSWWCGVVSTDVHCCSMGHSTHPLELS